MSTPTNPNEAEEAERDHRKKGRLCSLEGCNDKHYGRGWYRIHYWRWMSHRDVGGVERLREVHGMVKSTEYRIWRGMKDRCLNLDENYRYYKDYGARGIVVCERWNKSFLAFYGDMGARPEGDYSVDRKDNDANYSCGKCDQCIRNGWPSNCRWADRSTQNLNQRPRKRKYDLPTGVKINGKRYEALFQRRRIGIFDTIEEARRAHDNAKHAVLEGANS